MTPADPKPPTSEVGHVVGGSIAGGSGRRVLGNTGHHDALLDGYDPTADWRWPKRIDTIDAMRRDAQVAALELGMFQPIRRWAWGINPDGASDEVAAFVADNLGLPIVGSTPLPRPVRSRDRFEWSEHLRLILRAPSYGSAWFEQVARVDDGGAVRLRKLAPRPLRTLRKVNVARDGGLVSIEQGSGADTVTIDVSRLVAYVWDADPGSWSGGSMLRSLYRHWWLKDKLYRVDAMKHERFGAPMPIFEAPPEATEAQLEALDLLAQAVRSGDRAGGAVPSGTRSHLIGATGTGTDVVGSIRMHDEAMARAWASMVVQLGQTETGSRALGGTFADLLFNVQTGVAEWARDITQAHVVEDIVDWNFGPTERAPLLVFEPDPDPALSVGDLVLAINAGLVTVDTDLEAMFREKYRLPDRMIDEGVTGIQEFGYDLDGGIITIDERRSRLNPPLPPREDGLGNLTVPEFLAVVNGSTVADALGQAVEEAAADAEDDLPLATAARAGRLRRALARFIPSMRSHAADEAEADPMLPDRPLRRQRTEVERTAATDFASLDEAWESAVDEAVAAWGAVQAEQRAALIASIRASDGDLVLLASLMPPVLGADVIEAAIRRGIADGIASGMAEAEAQGITASAPSVDDALPDIAERSEALAMTMARSYGEAAGRHAMFGVGDEWDADAVVTHVEGKLDRLTDAFLRDQLGAAVQGGQNAGRFEAFAAAGADVPTKYVASEILDANTCGPCADIDGTEFESIAEAMAAYPMLGAYTNCEGGPRCRGTVVAVYDEATASVEVGG